MTKLIFLLALLGVLLTIVAASPLDALVALEARGKGPAYGSCVGKANNYDVGKKSYAVPKGKYFHEKDGSLYLEVDVNLEVSIDASLSVYKTITFPQQCKVNQIKCKSSDCSVLAIETDAFAYVHAGASVGLDFDIEVNLDKLIVILAVESNQIVGRKLCDIVALANGGTKALVDVSVELNAVLLGGGCYSGYGAWKKLNLDVCVDIDVFGILSLDLSLDFSLIGTLVAGVGAAVGGTVNAAGGLLNGVLSIIWPFGKKTACGTCSGGYSSY